MDLKTTTYSVDERVATITLNRPQRLNSWTGRMHAEYRWLVAQAEGDDNVRVIVVTGAGKGFCSGADAAALQGHISKGAYDPGTPEDLATPGYGIDPQWNRNFAFHFGLTKPVIAAINGPAAGVGFVLACYCDLRFAVRGAKLTTSHGRLGLPAEYGLSWLLPRLIGVTHANDMLLSSRVVLAEEAAGMGLINRLCERETLMDETYGYARMLAKEVAPSSIHQTKRQVYADLGRDIGTAIEDSEVLLRTMMKQPDYREGVAAYIEKREPRFPGNR